MDIFLFKLLKIFKFLALQLFTTKIFTTKKGQEKKFRQEKRGKNSALRDEKNIPSIIHFIAPEHFTLEGV